MIYNRFVFLVIISILSSLANSMAIEAKASVDSYEPITTSSNRIQTAQNSVLTQRDLLGNSDRRPQNLIIENSTAKESSVISKRWGFIGMAIVSLVSLFLLKLMFTPPASKISSTPKTATQTKDSKTIARDGDGEIIDTPDSVGDRQKNK